MFILPSRRLCWFEFRVTLLALQTGFLGVVDGFSWITQPQNPTYASLLTNTSLQWHFNLSSTERLTFITMKRSGEAALESMVRVQSDGRKSFYVGYNNGHVNTRGIENINLVVYNVTVMDEAQGYCCFVEYFMQGGAVGEQRSCIQFTVVDPPGVTSSPSNMTVNVSDTISLACNATGRPSPDIIWTRVNEPAKVLAKSKWLNLNITRKENGGEYVCTANNSFGRPSVARFHITVQYKPSIVSPPRGQNVTEGQPLRLHCNATGNPKPVITWKHPKSDVVGHGNTLTLNTTVRDNAGEYTCTAVNLLGSDQSKATILLLDIIYYQPSIIFPPNEWSLIRNESGTLRLLCNASGSPSPEVRLQYRGRILKAAVGSVEYSVSNISRNEAGTYECNASNAYGDVTHKFQVTVQYSPAFVAPLDHTVQVIEHDILSLICNVTGLPSPSVRWTRNGALLSNNSYLSKRNVLRTDAGGYECTATNLLGVNRKTVVVDVHCDTGAVDPATLGSVITILLILILVAIVVTVWYRHRRRRNVTKVESKQQDEEQNERYRTQHENISGQAWTTDKTDENQCHLNEDEGIEMDLSSDTRDGNISRLSAHTEQNSQIMSRTHTPIRKTRVHPVTGENGPQPDGMQTVCKRASEEWNQGQIICGTGMV